MIISYYTGGKRGVVPALNSERHQVMRSRIAFPLLPSLPLGTCLISLVLAGCGGQADAAAANGASSQAATPAGDLTPWQQEHGVGPITAPMVLAAVDRHEAEEGKKRFDLVCASCHKPDVRYVGPALGGVVDRRTPEFVMNMILAPDSMVARHPEAKKLFGTYMLQMPNMGLSQEQAREVLEYLRTLPAPPAQ